MITDVHAHVIGNPVEIAVALLGLDADRTAAEAEKGARR